MLDGVSKLFGKRHALRDVTVTLPADAVCGLVGANGAGKSTLLRCVIGLTEPSGGTGLVFGEKLGTDRAKRLVSYAPDELPMPDMLTGREYLDLIAGLEDRPPHLRRDAERLAAIFGVDGALTKLVGSYSHGMKRRLQFAGAFSSDARSSSSTSPSRAWTSRAPYSCASPCAPGPGPDGRPW